MNNSISRALAAVWVSLFIGCSSNNGTLADARLTADASNATDAKDIDATVVVPPDATVLQPVKVTVFDIDTGLPSTSAVVFFEDPDGTLTTQTTDITGATTATIAANGSVTTFQPGTNNFHLVGGGGSGIFEGTFRTVEGVQPGDTITFAPPVRNNYQPGNVTISATFPAFTPTTSDGIQFDVASSCGGGWGTGTTGNSVTAFLSGFPADCVSTQLVAAVADQVTQDFLAYQTLSDTSVANGQSVSFDSWLAPPTTVLTFSNLASPTVMENFNLTEIANGFPLLQIGELAPAPVDSAIQITHHLPPAGTSYCDFAGFDDGANGSQRLTMASPDPITSIDVGNSLAPWIDDYAAYDATTRLVTWTQSESGSADGAAIQADYRDAAGNEVVWNITADATSTSIALPHLPASLMAFDAPSELASDSAFAVTLFRNFPSAPYESIRAYPFVDANTALVSPWSSGSMMISSTGL